MTSVVQLIEAAGRNVQNPAEPRQRSISCFATGELGKAQETSNLPARLGPLVAQLTEAAASIRQSSGTAGASLATAEKLEAAAARLREAADAIDVPAIASAADTVQRKVGFSSSISIPQMPLALLVEVTRTVHGCRSYNPIASLQDI